MAFKHLALASLITISLSVTGATAMLSSASTSATEVKACATNISTVSSSISVLPRSTTAVTSASTAVQPTRTCSNATLTAAQAVQAMNTNQLRQALVECTIASGRNASKKCAADPSAKQLDMLFHILYDNHPQNLIRLGSAALTEALDRIDKNNWPLARIILLTANLTVTPLPSKMGNAEWIINIIIPIKGLTMDYVRFAFNTNNIECALFQAIEKEQWVTLNTLLKKDMLVNEMSAQTADSILFMGAIIYKKYWIIRRIAYSPILGPQLTYETCNFILERGRKDAIEDLRKSPYLKAIMKQAPTRNIIHPAAPDDEPSSDDNREVQAITACKKTTSSDDLPAQFAIQKEALKKTHDCAAWLAWKEPAPQTVQSATATS